MNQKRCLNTNHVYGTYSMKLMMSKLAKKQKNKWREGGGDKEKKRKIKG